MTNTQQANGQRTAPLRELEARFNKARAFILQHHPNEQAGDFGSMEGIESMHYDDLEILRLTRGPLVRLIEARAAEVQAGVEEAENARREQNMTEEQAWRRGIERSIAYLAAKVAKLEGVSPERLPALPHVARADIPQLLGQPAGLGRPAAMAAGGGGGGVRRLARGADASESSSATSAIEQGFTRRQHPLDVIGSSGGRG